MKRLLCLLAVAALAGCGSEENSWEAHPDGRIGPLQIDVSTEAEIRDFAGKPFKVETDFTVRGTRVGHSLWYRCGPGCTSTYSVNRTTGRLADYWTQSPRFVTERGSRVGMNAAEAAAAEGKSLVPGCGYPKYIHLRWDAKHTFVLAAFKGKVASIIYLGPHTVTYEGLC